MKKREKLFDKNKKWFCSRSCANSIGGKAKSQKYNTDDVAAYTTICWRHHKKECVVCGEKLIVAVHHLNENHGDNRPENLVPLCPTHHQYWHSKYKHMVVDIVEKYVKDRWAISNTLGKTLALQAGVVGSSPTWSTNIESRITGRLDSLRVGNKI